MNNYKLTLQSDRGEVIIKTSATDEQTARMIVCEAEGCPQCAIVKCEEYIQVSDNMLNILRSV